MRVTGKVKFFNTGKGYGFATRDDGQGDVFVHVTDVRIAGLEDLQTDDRISFEPQQTTKGTRAVDLRVL